MGTYSGRHVAGEMMAVKARKHRRNHAVTSVCVRLSSPCGLAHRSINAAPAFAQSGRSQARRTTAPAERQRNQRKIDEFAEAAQVLNGPAGNPECVWLGRRVVSLMWRDDLDTAFRHLDLYDRFGCPGGHVQATFRCLVRQGNIDPKAPKP